MTTGANKMTCRAKKEQSEVRCVGTDSFVVGKSKAMCWLDGGETYVWNVSSRKKKKKNQIYCLDSPRC